MSGFAEQLRVLSSIMHQASNINYYFFLQFSRQTTKLGVLSEFFNYLIYLKHFTFYANT